MPPSERLRVLKIRDDQGRSIPEDQLATSRLLRGEMITQDQIMERRDGQDVYVSLRGAPLSGSDGRIAGAVMIVHNDTERRRLEGQTQDSLGAMLRMAEMLVQNPSETTEPRPLLVGRRLAELACSLLGCPMATILSLDPATLGMQVIGTVGYTPEQEKYLSEIVSSWQSETPVQVTDVERLKSGETFLLDVGQPPYQEPAAVLEIRQAIVAPMLLDGQVMGLVIFNPGKLGHAFTKQQIALAGATAQMLGLVVERERLLSEREEARASALALQESNRQMDTFLGMVGHELRTPLASTKLSIQVIRHRLDKTEVDTTAGAEGLSPAFLVTVRKLVTDAERQVLRLERLLEDLLDASRINEGKLTLRLERADLATLVESAVIEQRQLWPRRVVQLQIPNQHSSAVQIDQDLVRQAVMNYVTNALKYSSESAPVLVGMDTGQRHLRVWVRDYGPGIALADQEHIWERFHRVPGIREQNETSGGLGLGLYVTRMVIEQHQGEVGIISALGRGSTFWFTLPRIEATKSRGTPGN
jgi:signal transduction histidine kinase